MLDLGMAASLHAVIDTHPIILQAKLVRGNTMIGN